MQYLRRKLEVLRLLLDLFKTHLQDLLGNIARMRAGHRGEETVPSLPYKRLPGLEFRGLYVELVELLPVGKS